MVKAVQVDKYQKPTWLKMSEADLKKLIAELAEKHQIANIGTILRDQYGVPTTKVYGKKLSKYMEELGIAKNQDLINVERKKDKLAEHFKKHITDKKAKHKMQKANSKVNALRKYSEKRKK